MPSVFRAAVLPRTALTVFEKTPSLSDGYLFPWLQAGTTSGVAQMCQILIRTQRSADAVKVESPCRS